jgi:hypothetical protein
VSQEGITPTVAAAKEKEYVSWKKCRMNVAVFLSHNGTSDMHKNTFLFRSFTKLLVALSVCTISTIKFKVKF